MDRLIESSPHNSSARSALLVDLDSGFSESGIQHRRRARYRRSLSWLVATRAINALRRVMDISFAALLLAILSPGLLLLAIGAHLSGGGIRRQPRLGRWATHFNQYEFCFSPADGVSQRNFLDTLPALFNVLKGEMSFIGPRAVSPKATIREERTAWKRYDLRPGLLSLWWLRKRANIAYSSEVDLDLEYVETNSLWGDFGIAIRAIPAAFFGGGVSSAPPELKFLGVRMHNLTMAEASAQIVTLTEGTEPAQICFVNADCVNIAFADPAYRATLAEARYVLADGIGVRVAGTIFNQHIRENINGTDMLPYLCAAAEEAGLSLYLLGGRPGVPEGAAAWIAERYPGLKIAGSRHGYFSEEEESQVIQDVAAARADILLVAFGAPRQDKWIAAHKNALGVKVAIGVGGLLDFYAGRVPRAPIWMREIGMEWLYRFYQEPRRMWRRYFLGNAVFLYRVFRERLRTPRDVPQKEGATL
jgi:N-acetylglucosaminyldiphosphoundecaprenol N-acetyl-beta-D-mannosaminyltransferase